MLPAKDDFWVFAYGSLMWNPGFPFEEKAPARIFGYHRALSVLSTIYRGTPEKPGLVLGLDRGGSCTGMAFRVAEEHVDATLAYLEKREQVTQVYCPKTLCARFKDKRCKPVYTFVVRRDHEQYAGGLSLEMQAQMVAQGQGNAGSALEYLTNSIQHMNALGIQDTPLHKILKLAKSL